MMPFAPNRKPAIPASRCMPRGIIYPTGHALISQATGRMQPKVSTFVKLTRQLYEHWAYIIRHYYPDTILQKDEDEKGNLKYSYFNPKKYEEVLLSIDINVMTMLPFDIFAEWEEANILYDKQALNPEQLIYVAPSLRDKRRAKDYVAKIQEFRQREEAVKCDAPPY